MYYNWSRRRCFYVRDNWGRIRVSCQPRYFPVLTPDVCAHLFLNNQNVPPICCGAWGVGCTPGVNEPIPPQGMRFYF